MDLFYQVAIPGPFNKYFTYSSSQDLLPGTIVKVPFGKRTSLGLVLNKTSPYPKTKEIQEVLKTLPHFEFFQWICHFYHYPLGQFIKEIFIEEKKAEILPLKIHPLETTHEQKNLIIQIKKDIFHKYYLYGPTGSGKTHLLLALAQNFLEGQVLYLTPEINLSETFALFFKKYIEPTFLFHSQLSPKKKQELVFRLQHQSALVLGARSALFLPFKKLSLIIVDEEHDGSYKQEERCRYQARDSAIKLAQILNIPIVLASATPSLEQYEKFFKQKLPKHTLLVLPKRRYSFFPHITCVKEPLKDDSFYPFQKESIDLLTEAFKKKEQALIFVNNLGFSQYLLCTNCSYAFYCPNCDLKLKYFKDKKLLSCYHCHFNENFEEKCPKCSSHKILHNGYGTEFVLKKIQEIFPHQNFSRFDKEELSNLKKFHKTLKDFEDGHIDCLIGTKLLSKGHNFKKVNSMILLGLDRYFSFIDFRNHEKALQQILQIIGRVGRFHPTSSVILQSQEQPDFLKNIEEKNIFLFYEKILKERQKLHYPPYGYLAALYFSHANKKKLLDFFTKYHYAFLSPHIEILGPRPCLIEKKKNTYTWTYLVKASSYELLQKYLFDLSKKSFPLKMIIDIQPWQLL